MTKHSHLVTIKREFAAPVEALYSAFTNPAYAKNWFGPKGYSVPKCNIEARIDGSFELEMHAPDGMVCKEIGQFTSASPFIELDSTYSASYGDFGPVELANQVQFVSRKDESSLAITQSFSESDFTEGAESGWNESLDRLEELINEINNNPPLSVNIKRTLAHPLDRVFSAFTDPEQAKKWMCPIGCSIAERSYSGEPDHFWFMSIVDPDGNHHPTGGHYTEITSNTRIRFFQSWQLDNGGWTMPLTTIIEFTGNEHQTTFEFLQTGYASPESQSASQGGWAESFVHLEQYMGNHE